eukprot:1256468-Pleurochrysis_carterae.AAC.1
MFPVFPFGCSRGNTSSTFSVGTLQAFYDPEQVVLFLDSFVRDVSGVVKFDGSCRGIGVADVDAVVMLSVVASGATSLVDGTSLPDTILSGTYDSASDDDDELLLEDNDVHEQLPVVLHLPSMAIYHDDNDDDGLP